MQKTPMNHSLHFWFDDLAVDLASALNFSFLKSCLGGLDVYVHDQLITFAEVMSDNRSLQLASDNHPVDLSKCDVHGCLNYHTYDYLSVGLEVSLVAESRNQLADTFQLLRVSLWAGLDFAVEADMYDKVLGV